LLTVALDDCGRRELDVQLKVGELLLRANLALADVDDAVGDLPRRGRAVPLLPRAQVVARADEHGRVGRRWRRSRARRARRDNWRLRPRGIVDVPAPIRLHRRIGITE